MARFVSSIVNPDLKVEATKAIFEMPLYSHYLLFNSLHHSAQSSPYIRPRFFLNQNLRLHQFYNG